MHLSKRRPRNIEDASLFIAVKCRLIKSVFFFANRHFFVIFRLSHDMPVVMIMRLYI